MDVTKIDKIYSTYTYINEKKNSRRKTQHSTHTLILEAELVSHVASHDFRRAKVVLAGWTLEVGGRRRCHARGPTGQLLQLQEGPWEESKR